MKTRKKRQLRSDFEDLKFTSVYSVDTPSTPEVPEIPDEPLEPELPDDEHKIDVTFRNFCGCCRNTISDDVFQLKTKHIEKYGGIYQDYEVHHNKITFLEIVKKYIEKYKIKLEDVPMTNNTKRYKAQFEFYFKKDRNQFKKYHDKIAELQVLSKQEHRKAHSRGWK